MELRKGRASDRDAIVQFDRVAQRDDTRVRFIDRVLREALCLVLENENGVIAYGTLEYSFYGQGFVSMLYVAESARRSRPGTPARFGCAVQDAKTLHVNKQIQ